MKSVRVILTPEAANTYNSFLSKALESKQEEIILNAFLQKVELLKENIHYGQPIAKKLIPAEYKTKYEKRICLEWNSPISGGCFTCLQQEVQVLKLSYWCLT